MGETTIKVSAALKDRIDRAPREKGLSAAGLIENLLDADECRRRMEAFGRAFREPVSKDWDEFQSWDLARGGTIDAA